jgi:4-amino-4-deoxy-L-arabinose transferase-like glycosyltransferase
MTPRRWTAIAIVAVCLCLRLLLWVIVQPWDPAVAQEVILQSDAAGYHELAVNLLSHHEFSLRGEANALRTPAYPLMLGLTYGLFGARPHIALLLQILLAGATCLALYLVVARAVGERVARSASFLFAIDPLFILFANTLYSDTLFVFLLVLGWLALTPALTGEAASPWGPIGGAAVILGLAALTRPIAVFLPIPVILSLLTVRTIGRRERLRTAAVFSLLFALTLSPWLIRNKIVFGSLALSTSGSLNMVSLFTVPVEMERRGIPDRKAVQRALFREAEEAMIADGHRPEELNHFEKAEYWRRLSIGYLTASPLDSTKHYLMGVFRLVASLGAGSYARILQLENPEFESVAHADPVALARAWLEARTPAQLVISGLIGSYLTVLYATTCLGIWRSRRSLTPFLVSCLVMAAYFVMLTGTAGRPRLRLPVVVFCLPFAGIGIEAVRARLTRSR